MGTASINGTKIPANASKYAANSYGEAGELIATLENEVSQLLAKAEDADSTPLEDGPSIPQEIARRESRKAQLQAAREVIETLARERAAAEKPNAPPPWKSAPPAVINSKAKPPPDLKAWPGHPPPPTSITTPIPRAGL